eukprot:TRINITY_DN54960_c0_g1_i1.p1 TRINITY_DN54960_c0_g1~~TRINITY_DN54960_c0_g1_i1.p1  ORF type:complete len:367 (-),score=65.42 TRINITY_DN54960_c0_g1_i1:108-1136(-)
MAQPIVIAVIADVTSQHGGTLQTFFGCIKETDAKCLLANTLESFVSHGTEVLEQVTAIVVGVFAGGKPQVIADLWSYCPNVRWIHSLSAGVDSLVPVLRQLPRSSELQLTNAKGAFSRSLAEYALMAMMHFNKQVPRCQENKRARKWDKFVMHEMHGATVGFVGFGDIAKTTVPLCRAFGMRVIALRRNKDMSDEAVKADEVFGIDNHEERLELFRRSDFVVCSLPGTPQTQHFCGAAEFGAMRETGVFISIGRGCCVDETALVDALRNGRIAGAALDVFEKEPLPEDSPVWEVDNLLLTAHNADYTKTYISDALNQFLEKFKSFSSAPEEFKGTVSIEHGY